MMRQLHRFSRPGLRVFVLLGLLVFARASWAEDLGWWPDPNVRSGLGLWVSYSKDYEMYQDRSFVDQQVADMQKLGIDVVFVAISNAAATPHLPKLSDKTDPFTMDVQYLLNQLDLAGIRASAALFSDAFTASDSQMARFVLVDHVINFNQNRDPSDAGFTSVATDLEMSACSPDLPVCPRSTAVYDKWKQFQASLKDRISPNGLKLVVWMQAPDALIEKMPDPDDQKALMTRENITLVGSDARGNIYSGAIKYFTIQNSAAIADAVVPQWYFRDFEPYTFRLDHNARELQNIVGEKPLMIAGIKINNGQCGADCLQTKDDYVLVLNHNDSIRIGSSSFIGTGVFKWPFPADWIGP